LSELENDIKIDRDKIRKLQQKHDVQLRLLKIMHQIESTLLMIDVNDEQTIQAAINFVNSWDRIDIRTGELKLNESEKRC